MRHDGSQLNMATEHYYAYNACTAAGSLKLSGDPQILSREQHHPGGRGDAAVDPGRPPRRNSVPHDRASARPRASEFQPSPTPSPPASGASISFSSSWPPESTVSTSIFARMSRTRRSIQPPQASAPSRCCMGSQPSRAPWAPAPNLNRSTGQRRATCESGPCIGANGWRLALINDTH